MSELKFIPGKLVEVSLDPDDSLDIWYPATFIKETSKGSFEVECKKSDESVPMHAVVDYHHIRPSPPARVNEIFQLLTKVDAFCNSGWSSGVVTKVLAEGRYIVYFKRTKKEKELKHTDLRLPILQSHGKWAHPSQVASVISNTREHKDISPSANGKISSLPENPGIIKESGEIGKSLNEKSRSVSNTSTDGDIQNKTLLAIRKKPQRNKSFKELDAEYAPEELRSPLEVRETNTAQTEQLLEKESSVEVSISGVKSNTPVVQSENGKSTVNKFATPERSMVASEEKSDLPVSRRTPFTGNRGRGRPVGSKTKNRASVAAGTPAAPEVGPVSLAECFQGHFGKPIVISLPCYNNSQWNKLQAQGTDKLPMCSLNMAQEDVQLPQEEKQASLEEKKQLPQEKNKQLLSSVPVGSTVNDLDNNRPETEGLNNENGVPRRKRNGPFTTPRRKRGRPFGSFSLEKRKLKEAEAEAAAASTLSNTQRRSTRERREVYKSAIDTLRPRTKKLRVSTENPSPTQEEKDEGVKTFSLTEFVEPISHGVSGNMSDDDMPLSTWFGEAHSLPNYTKPNSADQDSQSDKLAEQTDPDEKVGVTNADLVPSASQDEATTTMEREGDKVTDLAVNGKGLPFSKTSPIWEMIEAMEIFKKIPQNPHFTSLYATKEHCREGQAISSMVTFSHLVEDISKFQFDDPRNTLEERAETLLDLERQGFNIEAIRSRLNTLLTIKTDHSPAQSLESEIAQEQKQKAVIDEEMAELERQMAELREKQAIVALEKEKMDSKIRDLHSRFEPVREVLEGARSEFASLATAPW